MKIEYYNVYYVPDCSWEEFCGMCEDLEEIAVGWAITPVCDGIW